jgi:hypothetical protein
MKIKLLQIFLLVYSISWAQGPKKEYKIHRAEHPPKIDGILDDDLWNKTPIANEFLMLEPGNGSAERKGFETEVKVAYDDHSIYFGILMNDPDPDSILTQFTQRDNYGGNNDWFGVFINPFNDGLNDFNFWVTAAGVQADSRTTGNGDDFGWNTVWKSHVQITEKGWVLELAIPYQSLRFPKNGNGVWGLNMIRNIRRYREQYSWNFIDKQIASYELQAGNLVGVNEITPPLRLSIIPNVTASYSALPNVDETSDNVYVTNQAFNAGADIKYGINESFTLDMTLLPDFTQVAYDRQVLNLGPFENRFDEQRQFFKEGIELFNKGNLFYSRRIGGAPKNITNTNLDELDDVSQNTTRMLNATKVSGRTKSNLGIGVLNAITAANYATARDTIGDGEIQVLTEPMTNYNVISFDQRFNQNSSIGFVNTNVMRDGAFRDANVSALFLELANKANSYKYSGVFKYSNILESGVRTSGFQASNFFSKTRGNFRFSIGQDMISDTYQQNDLGFQTRNNRFNHSASLSYQIFEPVGIFNKYRINAGVNYNRLYEPNVYESLSTNLGLFANFRSFDAAGYNLNYRPIDAYNYFEPRVWGKKFRRPESVSNNLWFSSDYRRKFALDLNTTFWSWNEYDYRGYNFRIGPRYRFNDHFFMKLNYRPQWEKNDIGWVNTVNPEDSIVFGARDINQTEVNLEARYVFTKDISLQMNLRHFWTQVKYSSFYLLQDDGNLIAYPEYDQNHDINFNSLNLDVRFSWWFAPASQIVLLYRNSFLNSDNSVSTDYPQNFLNSIRANQDHTVSLRITYFFDVNYLRGNKHR